MGGSKRSSGRTGEPNKNLLYEVLKEVIKKEMLFYNLLSLSNGVTSYDISKLDTSRGLKRHCKQILITVAFENLRR